MPKFLRSGFRNLLARCKPFHVGDGRGDTFFIRYDLFKTRWGSLYLHEFKRSDHDRCLHDHPWPFTTLILRGGYWDVLPVENKGRKLVWFGIGWFWRSWCRRDPMRDVGYGGFDNWQLAKQERLWRNPGYLGRYSAEHAHRIEVDPTKPLPWSLVWVGKKSRPWGFWGPAGWVPWRKGQPNPICEAREEVPVGNPA